VDRRELLPLLRRRTLVTDRRAEPVRPVLGIVHHTLVDHGRVPGPTELDVLRDQVHQQVPDVRSGRDVHEHPRSKHRRLHDPAESHSGTERPFRQVGRAAVHAVSRVIPVHRLRQQVPDGRRQLQPRRAVRPELDPDRRRPKHAAHQGRRGGRRDCQLPHGRAVQAHPQPAIYCLHRHDPLPGAFAFQQALIPEPGDRPRPRWPAQP
jgi:hypothetical protein